MEKSDFFLVIFSVPHEKLDDQKKDEKQIRVIFSSVFSDSCVMFSSICQSLPLMCFYVLIQNKLNPLLIESQSWVFYNTL